MSDEELKNELAAIRTHISAECERVETRLLKAFHGWARTMEIRVRGASQMSSAVDERLALLEERVSEIERAK